ncbi:MAG TPA: hypothetical protein VEG84_03465, partial [Thermoanaerobaculia bacterium]|nr:hypothetical protein [Thermoanaerobaculia bacterium]
MTTRGFALTLVTMIAAAAPAGAQAPVAPDLFLHSVPAGQPTGQTLPLSLADAVKRGLDQNLGVILEQTR